MTVSLSHEKKLPTVTANSLLTHLKENKMM